MFYYFKFYKSLNNIIKTKNYWLIVITKAIIEITAIYKSDFFLCISVLNGGFFFVVVAKFYK